MSNQAIAAVVKAIDEQLDFLHLCRAVFPRINGPAEGLVTLEPADYFKDLGYHSVLTFPEPLRQIQVDHLNELAHWLNENFVVRLYGVMESHGLVGHGLKLKKELDGYAEIELTRRLRHQIGHGSKGYDPNDKDKQKLYDMLVEHLKIDPGYSYLDKDKYPIGVFRVLVPLADGCKRYAAAFLNQAAASSNSTT